MQEYFEETEEKTEHSDGLESENADTGMPTDPDADIFTLDMNQTKAYEKRSHRYQDTKDSAVALLVVGGLGFLFLALVSFQVIPIALNILSLPFLASVLLCWAFLIFGIISLIKSRKLKTEAEEEDAFTDSITKWLEEHIDASIVAVDEELSEADCYFLRCKRAKELLLKEFPNMDEDYMDAVLDENYDKLFEKK